MHYDIAILTVRTKSKFGILYNDSFHRSFHTGNPKLSIINRLVRNSGLDLSNVTLFAPSDDAFKALPADRLNRLLNNKECLLVS